MQSFTKNIKGLARLIARPFNNAIDVISIAFDRITAGLFGGMFLIAVTVSAQESPYTLMVKGERNPYDSAVAIELPTYRFETAKLQLGDELIDSLIVEVDSLRAERLITDKVIELQEVAINKQEKALQRQDSTLSRLDKNYELLYKHATKPDPWYTKPWAIGLLGLVLGILIGM